MSTQFTLPVFAAPRRYITSLNAMHHQPGGQRRMAPGKQKEPKEEIACENVKCGKMFTRLKGRHHGCSTECRAAIHAQKAEAHYAEIRAAKIPGRAHNHPCANDAKAVDVWERTRPGAKSFAQQTEDYYTLGMTSQQKRDWQAKQAAKLEILKRGMGL